MKKSVIIFSLVVLTFLLMANYVVAEEVVEVDGETTDEIEVMDVVPGAEYRLLQLEKQIRRRVLWGESVIEFLKDKGEETIEIGGIIEELKILADEASEIDASVAGDELVQQFIDIKMDAKDLVKEFKELVRELLSEDDRTTLREMFADSDRTELKELNDRISDKKRMLHAHRMRVILEEAGVDGTEITDKIERGDLDVEQVKRRIKARIAEAAEDKRTAVKEKLRGEMEVRRAKVSDRVLKFKEGRLDRASDRLQSRADKLGEVGRERASDAAGRLSDAFSDRADRIQVKRASLRERVQAVADGVVDG